MIETQSTEVILSDLHHDVIEVPLGVEIVQDTKAGEVLVGASLAVQCVAVLETVTGVEAQDVVLVLKTGDLP